MATIASQVTRNSDGTVTVLWEGLTASDQGAPVALPNYKLESIQMSGSFGGGDVSIYGSNAVANTGPFTNIKNSERSPLVASDASIFGVSEFTRWVKPVAGRGVADVDVLALFVPRFNIPV